MPKTKEQAEQSKRHIALKAKELFDKKGYFLTSMEEIRINTGMSKGNIYYHFKSKEALFLYILELYTEDSLRKWDELSSKLRNATEKLYQLAEYFVSDFESPIMKAAEEFARSQAANPEIYEKLNELNKIHYPIFRKILEEGMKAGEFREDNVEQLTLVLFGLLAGVGPVCQFMSSNEVSSVYKKSIDVFIKGIGK